MSFDAFYETMLQSREWQEYARLMQERPQLFAQSELLMIETDARKIAKYEMESGKTIGVVYQSPYTMMVVDLVSCNGRCFTYERSLPTVARGAVVSMPMYNGRFVLLRQFRHAMREMQYGFPRGFGEIGYSAAENLKKEISEEIGAEVTDCRLLGEVVSNSGLSGEKVSVYFCEVTEPQSKKGYEEIDAMLTVSRPELESMIRNGEINDGFTLSAYALYCTVMSADTNQKQ